METARKEIEKYFEKHEVATIPQLQKEFHLGYGKIRTVIDELIGDKIIRHGEGIEFEYCNDGVEGAAVIRDVSNKNNKRNGDPDDNRKVTIFEFDDHESIKKEMEEFLIYRGRLDVRNRLNAIQGEDIDEKDDIINLNICYPNFIPYDISLLNSDKAFWLTDNGITFSYLKSKINIRKKEYSAKIRSVLKKYDINLKQNVLTVKIREASFAMTKLILFVSAIEQLVSLADTEFIRKDERLSSVKLRMKWFTILHPDIDRKGAIELLEKKVHEDEGVEKKIKYDEIMLEAFKSISDANFERVKKKLRLTFV